MHACILRTAQPRLHTGQVGGVLLRRFCLAARELVIGRDDDLFLSLGDVAVLLAFPTATAAHNL